MPRRSSLVACSRSPSRSCRKETHDHHSRRHPSRPSDPGRGGRHPLMQTMFDSTDVSQIPSNATAVAGYVGGRWPTYPTLLKKFPNAHVLSIAVASRFDAECLDIEPGDATNDVAAGWVKRQKARGVKQPVLYTSVANVNALL